VWIAQFVTLPRDVRLFMRRELRTARSELRRLLVFAAIAEMPFKSVRRGTLQPMAIPPGCRFRRATLHYHKIWARGVSLRTRADIRRVLENFDKVVARLRVLIRKRIRIGAVVMVRAPEVIFITDADAPAAEAADTS
jgi:hypothetical protein